MSVVVITQENTSVIETSSETVVIADTITQVVEVSTVVIATGIDVVDNIGTGAEVFKETVDKTAFLRSITGSGEVVVTQNSDEIDIYVPAPTALLWGNIGGTLSNQTDLQLVLNSKQDTLVSGTNIKTINSNSILGSGDLVVDTAWGEILGNLSDQTDLQNALNAKQATLVSGTNIKTINGTSLLGSGDIVTASSWGTITGILSNQTDLQNALDAKGGLSSANVWTATNSFQKNDDGATGAITEWYHNSASPAANDEIGILNFYGKDSATNKTLYGDIKGFIVDPSNGSEDGGFISSVIRAGVATEVMRWGSFGSVFNGILIGTTTLPSPSGSNPTRAVFWNTTLNTNALLVGAGGGSGNAMTICDANTNARQIRFGYISTYAIVDSVNTPASGMLFRTTGDYTLACGNASRTRFATFAGTELATITYQKRFGIGTGATVEAAMHAINTSVSQLRLGYDFTNYCDVAVDSVGNTTFNLVGTTPSFIFSDPVNIQSSLQVDSIVNDTGLAYSTYSPTATALLNVTSVSVLGAKYVRVSGGVIGSMQVSVTATSSNTQTKFAIDLPIASNFANDYDANGSGYTMNNTINGHGVSVYADPVNNRLECDYYETHGGTDKFTIHFFYAVI